VNGNCIEEHPPVGVFQVEAHIMDLLLKIDEKKLRPLIAIRKV